MKRKAIFLDRDGVINALVFNADLKCWESPYQAQDAKLLEDSAQAIKSLASAGYMIFVVSNQPGYAKGKASLEDLGRIHEKIAAELSAAGAPVEEFYYCYHHPSGDKPGYSIKCECRKPKPYFLLKAGEKYKLDLTASWLVGDRYSDMECGAAAGVRTVLITGLQTGYKRGAGRPQTCAKNLQDAALLILGLKRRHRGGIMTAALNKLKIKIFSDGADVAVMKRACRDGFVKGFTTNPTLMKKAGITDYRAFAKEALSEIKKLPVSFEVFSDDFAGMEAEALEIASWAPNVYVKIPITSTSGESTIALIRKLSAAGLQLNITAIMTLEQVQAAADALSPNSHSVVSVFAGRVADTGRDPVPHMASALRITAKKPNIELLWASPRELLNIFQADACGCHIITVSEDILKKSSMVGMDLTALSLETVKMFHRDAVSSGFKIV